MFSESLGRIQKNPPLSFSTIDSIDRGDLEPLVIITSACPSQVARCKVVLNYISGLINLDEQGNCKDNKQVSHIILRAAELSDNAFIVVHRGLMFYSKGDNSN